ncbi:hypothetical protein AL048_05060 [Pseudomonas syringae pv. castaneae]|nr:hypothetical protein AL048_05060 [Pseudomonas syringae pv. castaneae]
MRFFSYIQYHDGAFGGGMQALHLLQTGDTGTAGNVQRVPAFLIEVRRKNKTVRRTEIFQFAWCAVIEEHGFTGRPLRCSQRLFEFRNRVSIGFGSQLRIGRLEIAG